MPQRITGPCTHPGCPARGLYAGRCAAHKRPAWSQPSRHHRALRGDKLMQLRARVLREQPVCAACQRRIATDLDHITPLSRGGSDDRANLQALCRSCHQQKTIRERRTR